MSRTIAKTLVLVNWKGVFYERYLIDQHVTALEGANGAGKTTVMIAAYVVLLPDMTRLRFTNLGETSGTGGDKGIWGRLGEPGRPAYSALDFTIAANQRLVAGVHLERKSEPSVELTPFIISDLDDDVRLQNVFLLHQGDREVVPELSELRENVARLGGRMQVFNTVRDYFAVLFDYGVTPMRLATDEERNKLNEMLHTSMMGGISRALTSELRSFLLKEETGLADTLQRMKANLDACKRTRTEVQEAQGLYREISGVFEVGQAMFTATFLATKSRADELRRRLTEAEEAHCRAREKLAEAENQLEQICDELDRKGKRHEVLADEIKAAETWLQRLQQAMASAEEVARWREELSLAETEVQSAEGLRTKQEEIRNQCRLARNQRQKDHTAIALGLSNLQYALETLHRRADAYRQVLRRKNEAERLLAIEDLSASDIVERVAQIRARLERVDYARRDARQCIADADEHRREHTTALTALETMANETIELDEVYPIAQQQLRRVRDLEALANRLGTISAELAEARERAKRQAEARERAKRQAEARERAKALGIPLSAQRPIAVEITEQLEQREDERENFVNQSRTAQTALDDGKRSLETLLAQKKELDDREPIWRDLAIRAGHLTDELGCSLNALAEIQAVRENVGQQLTQVKVSETDHIQRRDDLQSAARELLAAGGPFNPDLLRLKDELGAELLASAFEDASPEDAAVLEAQLGSLVQALVVDDPAEAAHQVQHRAESLSDVWLISRDEDATRLGDGVSQNTGLSDVIVSEQRAIRVTRIPSHPRLGRKAREQRAAELRAEADKLDTQIESIRTQCRRLERLARDADALLTNHAVWLTGDPAPAIDAIQRQISELHDRQEHHRAEVTRYQAMANQLSPRIEALRGLLGSAVLLDPPDHTPRREALERDYETAKAARNEIQRCREAARIVEDKLDVLRRMPLSETEVSALEIELSRLSDERKRLDAAVEAMEFVATNIEALGWDDAPEKLKKEQSLIPDQKEMLDKAEQALRFAEAAENEAELAFDEATKAWQAADARRETAATQFEAANRRFMDIGIPEPTQAAEDSAQLNLQRLAEESKALSVELEDLRKRQGRLEAEREQAKTNCQSAEQRVSDRRQEVEPVIEHWQRLSNKVAEYRLLPVVNSENRGADGKGNSANLVAEAHKQRAILIERLRVAHGAQHLLAGIGKDTVAGDMAFADEYLDLWLAVREWLNRRLPAQVAEVDDPHDALSRLNDQLINLEKRLARQEDDLRGASEDVARGIDVQIRKARGQVDRLNQSLVGVSFGSIDGIRVKVQSEEHMEQVLRALREGAVQELLFQENLPIEEALEAIFRRYGGGRTGGQRLLDYREYIRLQVEIHRSAAGNWEVANPNRLSTGEAIGVGAALMMVVLTEWERDANLLRGKRSHGSLRFLFLDEANRLSQDNLGVLFDLCQTLDLQLLIAAPEVARAAGNTTYHLVRRVDANGREEVLVSGRRMRAEA